MKDIELIFSLFSIKQSFHESLFVSSFYYYFECALYPVSFIRGARAAMCISDIGRNNTDCSKDDHKRDQYHPVTPSLACSVWVSCSLTSTVCVPTSPLATPTALATRSQLSEKNYEQSFSEQGWRKNRLRLDIVSQLCRKMSCSQSSLWAGGMSLARQQSSQKEFNTDSTLSPFTRFWWCERHWSGLLLPTNSDIALKNLCCLRGRLEILRRLKTRKK